MAAVGFSGGKSAEGSPCQPLHSFSRTVGTIVSSRPHNRLHVNLIRSWVSWQLAPLNFYLLRQSMVRFFSPASVSLVETSLSVLICLIWICQTFSSEQV